MKALKYAFIVAEIKIKDVSDALDIPHQQINDWFVGRRKIPVKYQSYIELITGINCEILQSDIDDSIKVFILENEIKKLLNVDSI